VQVSPVDIQAWASDTGAEYPATPAEKAAVLPAVAAWKAEQLADAKASRGQNAISPIAAGIGAAGLGLAGLIAFNHYRKQGISEQAAAAMAKQDENAAVATASRTPAAPSQAVDSPVAAPQAPARTYRAVDPRDQDVRSRANARSGATYNGPRLRANDQDGPTAATLETAGGRSKGATLAREQGQYKARTEQGFHNPALANLDSPEKRELYLAAIADANGTDSPVFQQAQQLVAAMETTTGSGVDPRDFLARNDASTGQPKPMPGKERFGTTTADEEAQDGGFLAQSRTKSNTSAQADYQSRESAPQSSGNPANASVFFLDSNGRYTPYRGNETLRDEDGQPVLNKRGQIAYTGLRSDGSPIAESDLAYFPTDDPAFYERTDLKHPVLSAQDIAANAGALPDHRFATDEDQAIKGMIEPLNTTDPRFGDGIRKDGVSDNWAVGRVAKGGERVVLDASGFQSESSNPTRFAAGRLRTAVADHFKRTGEVPTPGVQRIWATDLARQHGVDPVNVLTAAVNRPAAPSTEARPRQQAHALGAGTGDALDRVYNSLGMHAGADAWELEGFVRSGDIKGAAAALASQLPALTSANAGGLRGASQDEKLNIVAEGISAGLKDLSVTLEKYPQAAEKFGIGKGAGGFGVDAYLKSYVRDWVTVRGLQLDPTGQPTYQVPNDAFELIAHKAHEAGRSTLTELEDHIRGAANGLDGALRLDRLVSAAQSTKAGDPNTNATNFAQLVFDLKDPELLSTTLTTEAAGDVKLSFGTRRNYDATAGFYDRNPNEDQLADAISDYDTLSDGSRADYARNSILAARISGSDYTTEEGRAAQQAAKDAQGWISGNADALERERADFNRGILHTEKGPTSFGRGFVISADSRGAFLAGDTQGLNTSIREGQENDLDSTPVDRAQDHQREAVLNNQLPEPEGIDVAARGPSVAASEADDTARQYGATKLNFKNLGPGSRGAMADGEAFYPRQSLRRYLQERGQDEAVGRILDAHLPSSWQPEPGIGFEVGASSPIRGIGPRPAPGPAPITLSSPSEHKPTRVTSPQDLPDGAVDPYRTPARFQRTSIGRNEPMRINGVLDDRPPQLQLNYSAAAATARQPLTKEQIFSLVQPQPRAGIQPEVNTETAVRHRQALEARIGGVGSDQMATLDQAAQVRREQLNADRVARGIPVGGGSGVMFGEAASDEPVSRQGRIAFRDDQNLREATTERPLLDQGTLGGLGRQGSSFPQAPIAAAPVSLIPAAAQDRLNTLRSSLERPVTADISAQEIDDARARHLMSYIQSAATPAFDKGGRQVRGWTGGDSWHGGARLAGRADRNVGAYNSPSDAMLTALSLAARRSRAGAV